MISGKFKKTRFIVVCGFIAGILACPSIAQEFEISLPEGYKPNRFKSKIDTSKSAKDSSSKKKKLSSSEKLNVCEMYLFSKTSDGKSIVRRVDLVEATLGLPSSGGTIESRVDRVYKKVSAGKVTVSDGQIPKEIENSKPKKWWQLGKAKRRNPYYKLIRDGRRYFDKKEWTKSKEKFAQVLIVEPTNIEAVFKSACCDYYLNSSSSAPGPSYVIDEKLVNARENLVKAKRLYELSKNPAAAVKVEDYINKIDMFRKTNAGTLKEF